MRKYEGLGCAFAMMIIIIITVFYLTSAVEARVLWEDTDQGFALESGGWLEQDVMGNWLGVKGGLTIPEGGWMEIKGEGAIELFFPGIGWLTDKGMVIMHGCSPDMQSGRDTAGGTCGINADFACHNQKMGGRIFVVIRVRKFFPRDNNIPTKARWVTRKMYYDVEK